MNARAGAESPLSLAALGALSPLSRAAETGGGGPDAAADEG